MVCNSLSGECGIAVDNTHVKHTYCVDRRVRMLPDDSCTY